MRVKYINRKPRERHYILSKNEIELFVKVWNDRENFPEVSDVIAEMCYAKNQKALNIAGQLRDSGYILIERQASIISDADLINVWNDIKTFPKIANIGEKYNLKPRWISVRMCELRAIHGIERIPYRSHHHYNLRKLNEYKRKLLGK